MDKRNFFIVLAVIVTLAFAVCLGFVSFDVAFGLGMKQ